MGISVADNFKHLSKKFLDDRESFDTLADMKAVSDSDIPEGFETYCKATDKRYKFLSTNSVDANTGKWREVEYGGGVTNYNDLDNRPKIEGVTLTGNKTASDLGLAKANQIPTVPTKTSQLQNDSGFITNSALPGVYAGDTAGLVPAAGSDNEGKYLDNDGNWTDPLEDLVQNSGGKVLLDIPANTYASYSDAFAVVKNYLDTLSDEQLASIILFYGVTSMRLSTVGSNRSYYSFSSHKLTAGSGNITSGYTRIGRLDATPGLMAGQWTLETSGGTTFSDQSLTSGAQENHIQLIDTSVSATMIGKINRSDIYDTTEKVVGKWTDGRPLYQKTFAGTLNNANTVGTEIVTLVSVGASVSSYVEVEGFIINGTSNSMQAITTIKKGDYYLRMLAKPNNAANNANNIELYNAWFTSGTNTYVVTAKYTKTTDAANSYNYADENDYSTSEKIIGKWIDGTTLYQKTVNFGVLPNNTAKTVAHGISSLGEIINISGSSYILGGAGMSTKYYIDIPNNNPAINISVDSTNIYVTTESDLSSSTAYVTLKYTKS